MAFVSFSLCILEAIAVVSMFTRGLNIKIRGTMLGVFAFFSGLFGLFFVLLSKAFVSESSQYRRPYGVACYVDFFVALIAALLAFNGHLRTNIAATTIKTKKNKLNESSKKEERTSEMSHKLAD
jgi:hypothetical protein